jgi:hypothetical protein
MEIECPGCGADLLSQNTQILSSQVTLEYEIVGEVEIDCENCGEEVGGLIKKRLNNYSKLGQRVLYPANVFGDLRNFKETVERVLDGIEESQRGGARRVKALRLYFGLEDGRSRTFEEVGEELGVGRGRAQSLVAQKSNGALRGLRHPSSATKIHRSMWKPPVTVESLRKRAERAEQTLRSKGGDSQTEAN